MDLTYVLISIIIFLLAIDISLVIAFIMTTAMHRKERKELIDRVVAKSTGEYLQLSQSDKKAPPPKKVKSPAQKEIEMMREAGYLSD